jgi:hypothetical protein
VTDDPGIAHIPGGNDARMDGAVLDKEGGPPISLITTTKRMSSEVYRRFLGAVGL